MTATLQIPPCLPQLPIYPVGWSSLTKMKGFRAHLPSHTQVWFDKGFFSSQPRPPTHPEVLRLWQRPKAKPQRGVPIVTVQSCLESPEALEQE